MRVVTAVAIRIAAERRAAVAAAYRMAAEMTMTATIAMQTLLPPH